MTNRRSSASRSNHEAVWVAAHFCIRRPTWIEGNGNGPRTPSRVPSTHSGDSSRKGCSERRGGLVRPLRQVRNEQGHLAQKDDEKRQQGAQLVGDASVLEVVGPL